jgi:peptidoglycan/xylan/chitin deacetylase (PgdA/CDA1 family)
MRTQIKRAARSAMALVTAKPAKPSELRVLTYHRVARQGPLADGSWISRDAFRRQTAFIARECESVPLSSLLAARLPTNRQPVCVTIDDGHISSLDIAAPTLTGLGIDAAFFVPTDAIGLRDQLGREHIRELSDAGFSIGSHGCSHRSMMALDPATRRRDAVRSKQILEDITGKETAAFAYPFGTRRDFGPETDRVLERAGYRLAFTSQHGPVTARTAPLRVPRIKVEGTDSFRLFTGLVAGRLDAWLLVDTWLWWLQGGSHRHSIVQSGGERT